MKLISQHKKWMAFVTSAFFALSLFAPRDLYALSSSASSAVIQNTSRDGALSEVPSASAKIEELQIPPELGSIQEIHMGSQDKVVFFITDAHSVGSAQESIRDMILYLKGQVKIEDVALEGIEGDLDRTLLRTYPNQKDLAKILDAYVSSGELAGAAVASILDPDSTTRYWGIEKEDLYLQGIEAFLKALKSKEQIQPSWSKLEDELNELKEKFYSAKALKFDRTLTSFHQNKDSLSDFLKAAEELKAPDQKAYPTVSLFSNLFKSESQNHKDGINHEIKQLLERIQQREIRGRAVNRLDAQKVQRWQTEQLSDGEMALYLLRYISEAEEETSSFAFSDALLQVAKDHEKLEGLKTAEFFKEIDAYVGEIKDELLVSENEKEIDRLSHLMELQNKLLSFELTKAEWLDLQNMLSVNGNIATLVLSKNILNFQERLQSFQDRFKKTQANFFHFYDIALKRDQVFLDKLSVWMKRKGPSNALILVAGGFHEEGLIEGFKQAGLSYVRLMPAMSEIPDHSGYIAQMQGEISWRNYLRVENGAVNLYDGFHRAIIDKILHSRNTNLLEASTSFPLKAWRDDLIRWLAEKRKIEKASTYTRLIDEASISYVNPESLQQLKTKWQEKLEKFIQGLRRLDAEGKITQNNIANLFTQTSPTPYHVSPFDRFFILPASLAQILRSESRNEFDDEGDFDELEKLPSELLDLFQLQGVTKISFINDPANGNGIAVDELYDLIISNPKIHAVAITTDPNVVLHLEKLRPTLPWYDLDPNRRGIGAEIIERAFQKAYEGQRILLELHYVEYEAAKILDLSAGIGFTHSDQASGTMLILRVNTDLDSAGYDPVDDEFDLRSEARGLNEEHWPGEQRLVEQAKGFFNWTIRDEGNTLTRSVGSDYDVTVEISPNGWSVLANPFSQGLDHLWIQWQKQVNGDFALVFFDRSGSSRTIPGFKNTNPLLSWEWSPGDNETDPTTGMHFTLTLDASVLKKIPRGFITGFGDPVDKVRGQGPISWEIKFAPRSETRATANGVEVSSQVKTIPPDTKLKGISPNMPTVVEGEIVTWEPGDRRINISLARPNATEIERRTLIDNEKAALENIWEQLEKKLIATYGETLIDIVSMLVQAALMDIENNKRAETALEEQFERDQTKYDDRTMAGLRAIILETLIPEFVDRKELFFIQGEDGIHDTAQVKDRYIELTLIKIFDLFLNLPYGLNTKDEIIIGEERGVAKARRQLFEMVANGLIIDAIKSGNTPRTAITMVIEQFKENLRRLNEKGPAKNQVEARNREIQEEQIGYLEGLIEELDTYDYIYELNDPSTVKNERIEHEIKKFEHVLTVTLAELGKEIAAGKKELPEGFVNQFKAFIALEIQKGRPVEYATAKFFYIFSKDKRYGTQEVDARIMDFLMYLYDSARYGDVVNEDRNIIVFAKNIRHETDFNRLQRELRSRGKIVGLFAPPLENEFRLPHWFIFAKKFGIIAIPFVDLASHNLKFEDIQPGAKALVDGEKGVIILNATPQTREGRLRLGETYGDLSDYFLERAHLPVSFGGQPIFYWIDESAIHVLKVDNGHGSIAARSGAIGVGLLRLEEIILDPSRRGIESDENRLSLAIAEVLSSGFFAGGKPVVVRMFDVAPDKRPHFLMDGEWVVEDIVLNRAGARFYIDKDKKYRAFRDFGKRQLKALFHAYLHPNVNAEGLKILFSDVKNVVEIVAIEDLINEARDEFLRDLSLNEELLKSLEISIQEAEERIKTIPIGYMFEDTLVVESELAAMFAAMNRLQVETGAPRFAADGTNDLAKSIIKIRLNGKGVVGRLNPYLIHDLAKIAREAQKYNIPVTLEGEAGNWVSTLLTLLIFRQSLNLNIIPVAATARVPELLEYARNISPRDLSQPVNLHGRFHGQQQALLPLILKAVNHPENVSEELLAAVFDALEEKILKVITSTQEFNDFSEPRREARQAAEEAKREAAETITSQSENGQPQQRSEVRGEQNQNSNKETVVFDTNIFLDTWKEFLERLKSEQLLTSEEIAIINAFHDFRLTQAAIITPNGKTIRGFDAVENKLIAETGLTFEKTINIYEGLMDRLLRGAFEGIIVKKDEQKVIYRLAERGLKKLDGVLTNKSLATPKVKHLYGTLRGLKMTSGKGRRSVAERATSKTGKSARVRLNGYKKFLPPRSEVRKTQVFNPIDLQHVLPAILGIEGADAQVRQAAVIAKAVGESGVNPVATGLRNAFTAAFGEYASAALDPMIEAYRALTAAIEKASISPKSFENLSDLAFKNSLGHLDHAIRTGEIQNLAAVIYYEGGTVEQDQRLAKYIQTIQDAFGDDSKFSIQLVSVQGNKEKLLGFKRQFSSAGVHHSVIDGIRVTWKSFGQSINQKIIQNETFRDHFGLFFLPDEFYQHAPKTDRRVERKIPEQYGFLLLPDLSRYFGSTQEVNGITLREALPDYFANAVTYAAGAGLTISSKIFEVMIQAQRKIQSAA